MTTLRQAAQQALEALAEMNPSGPPGSLIWHQQMDAIIALRAALAQPEQQAEPEQEPVAWMDREGDLYKMPEIKNWAPPHTLLYTAPPQRKE